MGNASKHVIGTVLVLALGTVSAGAAVVWSGAVDVGADNNHPKLVKELLATVRDRSIQVRAEKLQVPDFGDTARIVQGAGNYNAMCIGCHLAPGMGQTELSQGLYPAPPDLTKDKVDLSRAFWVIKHGIKSTGMPAWGKSMKDEYIWDIAAFLQKLPDMNQQQYEEMVASSSGHSHGGSESGGHSGQSSEGHHDKTEPADQAHHKPPSGAPGDSKEHADDGQAHHENAESSNSRSGIKPASKQEHHDDGHKH